MYNKLFTKILDSSIWLESSPTRIVWLTFLAVMDEKGFAPFAALGNVANRAMVTLEEAKTALGILEAPDPESSDPENEGRRLERVPGGWMVLNAQKHRDLLTRAIKQAQTAERVRRFRQRMKRDSNALITPSEAYSEANTKEKTSSTSIAKKPTTVSGESVSNRPVFKGQRFTVLEWMLENFMQMLGGNASDFALDEWFYTLDAKAQTTNAMIDKKKTWDWLHAEFIAEADRRKIPRAGAKQTDEEIAADILAAIREKDKRQGRTA